MSSVSGSVSALLWLVLRFPMHYCIFELQAFGLGVLVVWLGPLMRDMMRLIKVTPWELEQWSNMDQVHQFGKTLSQEPIDEEHLMSLWSKIFYKSSASKSPKAAFL